jgi:hypothetical protein
MFGKKVSGQKTTKLYMTPAIESAVNPGARNFQVSLHFGLHRTLVRRDFEIS